MTKITELSQLDLNATYSYADYLTWQLEETVELIKGKIMAMSPAPSLKHQSVITNLGGSLYQYFHKKTCKLFYAPFDIKLYNSKKSRLTDQQVFSVVQPDLCVICDKDKLTEQGCNGAPDWIIEVLSPGNTKKEMRLKYDIYQENGVIEYWLVYPYEQAVYQFVLDQDTEKYQLFAMYAGDDLAKPYLFPELHIDLADVFAE
ncbi:MAG: Uma2 family endonuclease [Methylobacter tundripaludum]|uniref:Uma2 family endonuclease n=1 Tax=Methylobacter tundripaludum TaxID=173365 RepID=A0A2S6H5L8_9GAMM|nr:Uma2 family endonuclease [Methylobacter tundripaludum]MCK9635112.1 Uma2 family endonuclease [Methylobacter tundripaludum]PPK72782.1 Uma2 family endonuclease [Methylobacter tundripaludum]